MVGSSGGIYRFGRLYDLAEIFFRNRLSDALDAIPFQPGDRVLDVGVGTGFSLKHYPAGVRVTGIDTSNSMLEVARKKLADKGLQATVELQQADALALPFPAETFDVTVMLHVIGTVSDSDKCLREGLRVTRESGILVMLNHFRSQSPLLRRMERFVNPLCEKLGWRTNLSLGALLYRANASYDQMACEGGFGRIVYLQKWRGNWRVIYLPQPERAGRGRKRAIASEGPRGMEMPSLAEVAARTSGPIFSGQNG